MNGRPTNFTISRAIKETSTILAKAISVKLFLLKFNFILHKRFYKRIAILIKGPPNQILNRGQGEGRKEEKRERVYKNC